MLGVIDRYVIREVLPPFAIALGVFTFTLELRPLGVVAEPLIAKGVPLTVVARVMAALMPQELALTIPMALLVGLLVAFGRQSTDREHVALQACGVSLLRLLRPVVMIGLVASIATFWMTAFVKPAAATALREVLVDALIFRPGQEVKPRVFFDAIPGRMLYVQDVSLGEWQGVFLADTTAPDRTGVYIARRGRLIIDRVRQMVALVLEDGAVHITRADKPAVYQLEVFRELRVKMGWEALVPRSLDRKRDGELTMGDLRERLAELRRLGVSATGPLLELHQRSAFPAACLVFGVIGIALGSSTRRGGRLASFMIGLVVLFAYYVLLFTGRSLAIAHAIPVWVAAWAPNLVLGTLGAVGLFYRARSAGLSYRIDLPLRRLTTHGPALWRPPRFSRVHILDQYVAKLFLGVFTLTFCGLLGMFYVSAFTEQSDALMQGTASIRQMIAYQWLITPQLTYYSIPIAVLFGTLVTIGLLVKNSELVVMKACGLSLYRVAAPVLVLAAGASAALFLLQERLVPYSNRRAEAVRQSMHGGPMFGADTLNRTWITGRAGALYHFDHFDPGRAELSGLSIYEMDTEGRRLRRRTYVQQATYAPARAESDETWRGRGGRTWEFDEGTGVRLVGEFSERRLPLEPISYFGVDAPDTERMTFAELRRYVADLRLSGFNTIPYVVALHRKLSFPFVTLIMTLMAIPFAVTVGRRGALYGVGVGISLALAYWTTMSVFGAIGKGGALVPALAAWAPNILFGTAAIYLLLRTRT